MANLTADRKAAPNLSYVNLPYFGPFGLAANQVIYGGCMYALDSAGRPVNPGSTAVIVAGVATEHYSNTAGAPYYNKGTTDGLTINLHSGVFMMDVHATHPPTAADLWGAAYASDNHTISRLASDGSYAGTIVLVEGATVYVYFSPFGAPRTLGGGLTALVLTENAGVIGGVNDGNLPDLTATAATLTGALTGAVNGAMVDVAAAAGACAGNAEPSAANVDTAIATAVATIVSGVNEQNAEMQAQINKLIADNVALRAAIREVAANDVKIVNDLG